VCLEHAVLKGSLIMNQGSVELEHIQIIKKVGGKLTDSYLDEGFILDKTIAVNSPKRLENAKIMIANTCEELVALSSRALLIDSKQWTPTKSRSLVLNSRLTGQANWLNLSVRKRYTSLHLAAFRS
jgi:hypothetical protein